MTIEEQVKALVLKRYSSIREFTKTIGMPNSTFVSIMQRGVKNSTIQSVFQICDALDIKADALLEDKIVEKDHSIKDLKETNLTTEEWNKITEYADLLIKARKGEV